MTILSVKEFNRIKKEKWERDIEQWKKEKNVACGMPFLPMYLFIREDTGMPRKRGYVISEENSHTFCLTKKELQKKLNLR